MPPHARKPVAVLCLALVLAATLVPGLVGGFGVMLVLPVWEDLPAPDARSVDLAVVVDSVVLPVVSRDVPARGPPSIQVSPSA